MSGATFKLLIIKLLYVFMSTCPQCLILRKDSIFFEMLLCPLRFSFLRCTFFSVQYSRRCFRHIAHNVPAAWRSWGGNCTQFGLSPAVNEHKKIRTITSPPNFAKPLVICWHFFYLSENPSQVVGLSI